MTERITQGPYAGWTVSDWTDLTLERLRWKLDEDKRQRFLEPWMRSVIFGCLKAAKTEGAAFRFAGKRFKQVREILKVSAVDDAVIE